MRLLAVILVFLGSFGVKAQESNLFKSKKIAFRPIVVLDSVGLNPSFFRVLDAANTVLNDSIYEIDFSLATLTFSPSVSDLDSISVEYLKYPDFLTKTYRQLDNKSIVPTNGLINTVYRLNDPELKTTPVPFGGLTTSGNLSRGITLGNNQNSVLNSELDLQISGKLNDKVTLRASIQDANIPIQDNAYSQRLDQFDQVFIEAFTDKWLLRAGDIDLQNNQSYFAEFSKRVQGLLVTSRFQKSNSEINAFASGALVRGQFMTSQFVAIEGNQGPYKLKGPNNELFVLIVSGSETVYVNGVPLVRGANNDYIVDYNAGEITFNSTYPINSEMRITVDYQYSERNYSRFVGYSGANYSSDKLQLGVSFFNENDIKNQPLQQNLTDPQMAILSNAGDDRSLMTAPSARPEEYSNNRILYKKTLIDGIEVFEFSNNPEEELFQVQFIMVGEQQGDYILSNSNTISNIYEYISPVNGQKQGSYAPIVQLVAPVKLQMAVIQGTYKPSHKTTLDFEIAASHNDLNLFSSISDDDNNGVAARYKWTQNMVKSSKGWSINLSTDLDYIQKDFRNIQGLYQPEFNRDWNLDNPNSNQVISDLGTQVFTTTGVELSKQNMGQINYGFEHLNFSERYNGNRHIIKTDLNIKNINLKSHSSVLNTNGSQKRSTFLKSLSHLRYNLKAIWPGAKFGTESNEIIKNDTNQLDTLSQRFRAYEGYLGVGDSTQVFVKLGYIHRLNDSVQNNQFQQVNTSNTYYLNTKLIQTKKAELSLFTNYRVFNTRAQESSQKTLNSRLFYHQKVANNLIQWQTIFETNSGRLPQQDYTYIEVEPGQGGYVWLDFNGNGIQEIEEFEVAQFQDQATYIRVLLPNRVYIKTHQNRLSQSLTIDPIQWKNSSKKGQQFWSHFYNLTAFSVDRKDEDNGQAFNLNPFKSDSDRLLGLQYNFRNQLFFNRGLQHFTTSYIFSKHRLNNKLSFGSIYQEGFSHQLNFTHKIKSQWLINFQTNLENNASISENFSIKNFNLNQVLLTPKVSYLLDENKRFDLFYKFQKKKNLIQNQEVLTQHNFGLSFTFTELAKAALSAEFNYYSNDFLGSPNTSVAYQMMQGLQPGTNFTWSLVAQKKITKYLDLNLNYFGRQTMNNKSIHTGTIQLKAYF